MPDGKLHGLGLTHISTGIPVDLFVSADAPQALLYVRTLPVSEAGEPWIAQRLLLGAARDTLAARADPGAGEAGGVRLAAQTTQSRTVFQLVWPSEAGDWLAELDTALDAIINPQVSEARIRELIWSLDVIASDVSGRLELIEQGTLYREAVARAREPRAIARELIFTLCYGRDHPMGAPAHGTPNAMRELRPEQVWDYLSRTYYPDARVGLILFAPPAAPEAAQGEVRTRNAQVWPPAALLTELDAQLRGLRERRDAAEEVSDAGFWRKPPPVIPPFSSRDASALYQLSFPADSSRSDGVALLGWRPRAGLDVATTLRQQLLWGLLARRLSGPGGHPDLQVEFPALEGDPVLLWLPFDATRGGAIERLRAVRRQITTRLASLAEMSAPPESLSTLRIDAQAELAQLRETLRDRLEAPPAEGQSGDVLFWVMHCARLRREEGSRKDLALAAATEMLSDEVASGGPWAGWVRRFDLRRAPYMVAVRPDPERAAELEAARRARLQEAAAALQDHFGAADWQEALRRFRDFLRERRGSSR
ncbi:MAG: hypothetical protein GF330_07585 [Candidatus Eisenbacteria bacterium]|nr:hypothetical protein [Candidatus Eisenbacteria bacterium]